MGTSRSVSVKALLNVLSNQQ